MGGRPYVYIDSRRQPLPVRTRAVVCDRLTEHRRRRRPAGSQRRSAPFRTGGPSLPARTCRGTASSRHARRTGSMIRQVSTAWSPRTESVGSPASTPASTCP